MNLQSIFAFLILIVISTDSKPHKPQHAVERQVSWVIPAYGFLGGGFGNSQNYNPASSSSLSASGGGGFGNLLGGLGGVSTRTVFRTVTTVTVATYRTCTSALPAAAVPCGKRRRRDLDGIDSVIEPTMVLIVGQSSITNQERVSRILGLPIAQDDESEMFGNVSSTFATTLLPEQDPTTILYPTPSDDNDRDDLVLDDETTTNTPLADFWKEVNQENLSEDEKARLAFGGSTTTVTVSMTGIAYTTVNSPVFTVSYAGCSPLTFPVTSSSCS